MYYGLRHAEDPPFLLASRESPGHKIGGARVTSIIVQSGGLADAGPDVAVLIVGELLRHDKPSAAWPCKLHSLHLRCLNVGPIFEVLASHTSCILLANVFDGSGRVQVGYVADGLP